MAVWMVPFHWLTVARQASEVWMVDGAAARVRSLRAEPGRRRPGAALVLVAMFVVTVVLMLGPVGALAGGLAGGGVAVVPVWLEAVGSVWLAGVVVLSVVMSWQPRQSRMRPLLDRTTELVAAGDGTTGYVVSEVVASRPGSGAGGVLLIGIQAGWRQAGAVGVLYAASDDLVGYYRRYGWGVDLEGDGRRMIWRAADGSG